MRRYLPKNTEQLMHWYERYISPVSLVAGFLADNLILLRRVDLWTSNLLLLFYLVVSAVGIAIINLTVTGRLKEPVFVKAAPFLPIVVQFAFGGLFSAYLTLYIRSAGFASSWIFIVLIAGLLLGNERFTRSYAQFPFQITIFFTVLFSFLIFFVPLVLGQIGPLFFLISGAIALVVMAGIIRVFAILMPEHVRANRMSIIRRIATVFVCFNILYFFNAIPPLPLALKDAGVYHGVEKVGEAYELKVEDMHWYLKYLPGSTVFHRAPGESIFLYSAVFAPTKLSTTILHEWQHYDEKTKTWITASTFGFPIAGGRDSGYRGYSIRENVVPGNWRVNVKTGNGLLIGRVLFTVVDVQTPVKIVVEQG